MSVFAVVVGLVAALCVGYHLGRRAGRRTPTWKVRTSRAALGRQAVGLVVLLAAARLERSVRRRLPTRYPSWLTGR